MDSYVIVSGPALAGQWKRAQFDNAEHQYIALLYTGDLKNEVGSSVACLTVERNSSTKVLGILGKLDTYTEMEALLGFVVALAQHFKGQTITLNDENATKMADLVTFSQTLEEFKAKLDLLSIVVEAVVDAEATNGKVNSVRFTDHNVAGLSHVKTASSIVMTVKAN
jgi:hypothetical protein